MVHPHKIPIILYLKNQKEKSKKLLKISKKGPERIIFVNLLKTILKFKIPAKG